MSSLLRFLGITSLALFISPLYLIISFGILKGLYQLKNFSWTKIPPYNTHFHWLLSYFVNFFIYLFVCMIFMF